MTSLLVAAIAAWIVGGTPENVFLDALQKPVVQHTVDYITPPDTLEGLWREVDVVVLAQVEASVVQRYDLTNRPDSPRVATEHTVRIVEVFKRDSSGIGLPGSSLQVLQSSGELDLGNKIVRVNGGAPSVRAGDTYVMFLGWNRSLLRYELAYGPFAMFRINGNQIDTPAPSGPAVAFRGRSPQGLLAALRELGR